MMHGRKKHQNTGIYTLKGVIISLQL